MEDFADRHLTDGLPRMYFGFPGALRDRLVAAILAGTKTATTSLVVEYEHDGTPLPRPGRRAVLVDSADRPVAVLETTSVLVVRLADVDRSHCVDEGEGHDTVAAWRAAHEHFWHDPQCRAYLGDPAFVVNDDTPVLLERFRVATQL